MSAFSNEIERSIFIGFETNPNVKKILYSFGSFSDDGPNHAFIAQPITALERVFHMGLQTDSIGFVKDSCNASLGPIGRGVGWSLLGDNGDGMVGISQS
jgi:hypothetical protein